MSIYKLKSSFQTLLRPLVNSLAKAGVTANQVTLLAALVSVVIGGLLWVTDVPALFLLIPVWMLLRMGLNAVDGMLAREHGQQTPLGGYLNELGDVVSDAALYAPFALVAPFTGHWISAIILLSVLSEFAGVLGVVHGNGRRYDGPLGKSDRALVFALLGVWVALADFLPAWAWWVQPAIALATILTVINRIRQGLTISAEA